MRTILYELFSNYPWIFMMNTREYQTRTTEISRWTSTRTSQIPRSCIPSAADFALQHSYHRFAISLSLRRTDARCRGERNAAFRPARSCSKTALTFAVCALGLSFRAFYSQEKERESSPTRCLSEFSGVFNDHFRECSREHARRSRSSRAEDRRSMLGSLSAVVALCFRAENQFREEVVCTRKEIKCVRTI